MRKSVHNEIPGPLREFRAASDERAGPGNEAMVHFPCALLASFPGRSRLQFLRRERPGNEARAL